MARTWRYPSVAVWLAAGTLLTAAPFAGAQAAPDPLAEYAVTPQAGAWLICVTSYTGDHAGYFAGKLIEEVRTRYRLPAYVFNRGAQQRREQDEEIQRRREQQHQYLERIGVTVDVPVHTRTVHIEDQYAVLVGGYPDADAARKALDKIKKLDEPKSVQIGVVRWLMPESGEKNTAPKRQVETFNPFRASFVVRNPTIATDHAAGTQLDDLATLKRWNADEDYSLLNCRKPWTLMVQNFQGAGAVVLDSGQSKQSSWFGGGSGSESLWKKMWFNDRRGEMLGVSAMQAHALAEALRKMGFSEAYVLHARFGSMVTVGGFDGPQDPQLIQMQRSLANLRFPNPKTAEQIKLFAQPVPYKVPTS